MQEGPWQPPNPQFSQNPICSHSVAILAISASGRFEAAVGSLDLGTMPVGDGWQVRSHMRLWLGVDSSLGLGIDSSLGLGIDSSLGLGIDFV
jgi:hypothetical protein